MNVGNLKKYIYFGTLKKGSTIGIGRLMPD